MLEETKSTTESSKAGEYTLLDNLLEEPEKKKQEKIEVSPSSREDRNKELQVEVKDTIEKVDQTNEFINKMFEEINFRKEKKPEKEEKKSKTPPAESESVSLLQEDNSPKSALTPTKFSQPAGRSSSGSGRVGKKQRYNKPKLPDWAISQEKQNKDPFQAFKDKSEHEHGQPQDIIENLQTDPGLIEKGPGFFEQQQEDKEKQEIKKLKTEQYKKRLKEKVKMRKEKEKESKSEESSIDFSF